MKYVKEYLEEVIKIKPLGKLSTSSDCKYDLSGEEIYIDGKPTNIFIAHIDYSKWLEKKITNINKT